jgi:1-acyl-sn-glycerol-3-phosphate acyltransferase
MVGVLFFDLRCYGRQHLHDGAALVLSTHQSNFDPVLVGLMFNDRLNYLARRTLFKNRLFAGLIRLLDAIELDRDRSGLAGLKETLKRLKADQKVLVFPEGTRTPDGKIAELKPGFLAVARRSQVPLIPIAITGAYEVLPRGSKYPRRYPIRLAIGPLVKFADYENLTDAQALQMLSQRLHRCYSQIQWLRVEHA